MLLKNRKGVGVVEYLMLVAIVVLGAITGLNYFKTTICNSFANVADVTKNTALALSGGSTSPSTEEPPPTPMVIIQAFPLP